MALDRSIVGLSILLFVVCTWCNLVDGKQKFIEIPAPYQEVSSGQDVELRCTVQDKRGKCIWQKDGRPVGIYSNKYEWASNQNNDCTLLIRNASLDFDDGLWECQVTSSNFERQDALTSEPCRLLVKVKPNKPILEYHGRPLGSTLTLEEGQEVLIACTSKRGNPPALLKWFIGNNEVESRGEQQNATEVDSQKTWIAQSLIMVHAQRKKHGLPIRCVAVHPTSLTPPTVESRLDIYYSPEVRVETDPQPLTAVAEDSTSFFSLKCLADANPAASITWFKDSKPLDAPLIDTAASPSSLIQTRTTKLNDSVWSTTELRFQPVKRHDAGLYSCEANNNIGEKSSASYRLDVQYAPKLKRTVNDTSVISEVALNSTVEPFECPEFEANPPAQYKWVRHRSSSVTESIENRNRDDGRRLLLENIMWSDEGEYHCIAFNIINGIKRETVCNASYTLWVTGPPEIQSRPLNGRNFYESIGWAGEPVHRLKSRFCSQPSPKLVAWQWGSSHIRAGEKVDPKYEALPLQPIVENNKVTNCYWAKLQIKDLKKEDGRIYTLLIESEMGRDSMNIKLIVRDPTETRVIAAAVAVGLLFLFLLIAIAVYSALRVRGQYRQKMIDEGSIAADALYNGTVNQPKSVNSSHVKTFARKSSLDNGTYDYSHIAKQTCAMSPEALKVRRAPAVLQPPTIV